MDKFQSYHRALNFLENLSNLPLQGDYTVDRDHPEVYIKRMRYFLNLIGNPDRVFKFIHIGGTSGKGTVTSMVHEALLASGKRVGSFTSPAVTASIEKIKVGNEYIEPGELADIVEHLKPFIDEAYLRGPFGRPSYFEIFLAIALVYFKRRRCEWVVLEVGLGGRYDATNVIEKPVVTAVTNIDYDHTEVLGKTLKKIALDKAGIVKRGSAFFTTEQRASIVKIFNAVCRKKSVTMCQLPHQQNYRAYNAELAAAICRHVGIKDRYVERGIKYVHLPCRFEIMQERPSVVLDGAHNRSKIKTTLTNLRALSFEKLHLVIGIADSKDHVAILAQLVSLADRLYFTRFQNRNRQCAHPKQLAADGRKYMKSRAVAEIFLDPSHALEKALGSATKKDLILVTGSFYLAGELRRRWIPEESILVTRKASTSGV